MNENKIVDSAEQRSMDHRAITVLLLFGLCVACLLLAALAALTSPKVAFIVLFVLIGVAVAVWQVERFHERYKSHQHHTQEIANQKHHRTLAECALDRGYSVHLEHPDGRKVILTSPLTIPGAPVKIEQLNWGMPQLSVSTLPDKTLALDIMRKWALTPQNVFLALGKGGKEYACTLEGLMHVAHDAPTDQGKTSQWKNEIVQLLKLNVQVILANPHFAPVDKKGNDWRPIGRAIEAQGPIELDNGMHIPGLIRKYETIVNMLKWLSLQEIDRRFTLQAQGNYSFLPLYIFLDEWPSIVARYPIAAIYLVDVLQRGRAVDVCVDTNAQGYLQDDVDLKGSARENFNTAYHMGGSAYSGAKLLDMPVKDYNEILRKEQVVLGKGIALLRNNESVPRAELVRLPYADNDYVHYMLGRADSWQLPEFRGKHENGMETDAEKAIEADLVHIVNVSDQTDDSSSNDGDPVGNEIRETIKRLRKRGLPLREIAPLVGMAGRKYEQFKRICDEEGL